MIHRSFKRNKHSRPSFSLTLFLGAAAAIAAPACGGNSTPNGGGEGGATGGSTNGGTGGATTGGSVGGGAGGSLPGGSDASDASDVNTASDAGVCDEFVMPEDCTVPSGAVLPGDLRCTGLYSDWPSRTLRCGVQAYTPAYQLWTDGAGKQRYAWLPPGGTIDTSDPDNFVYPVGARFWKEFYIGPEGNQKLGETRYLLKVKGGWLYTAYVWSEDGKTATQTNFGVDNLFGTGHSVPTREQCKTCHSGRPDFVLGWDFIMLGKGASGVTARQLADSGRLSGLDPAMLDVAVPGDAVEQKALAYLHANCGVSCHNPTSNSPGKPSGLFMRLQIGELDSVFSTGAVTSGINKLPKPNADFGDLALPEGGFYDFRPLDAKRSLVTARMAYRGSLTAMPPIGTNKIHEEGLAAVTAWVESMTIERGYPAPAP